jgi:hypothetical protein
MTGARARDIVTVNHKGREWVALVVDTGRGHVLTRPLTRTITRFDIPTSDITGIYRPLKGSQEIVAKDGGGITRG